MELKKKKTEFYTNSNQTLHQILENAAPLLDRRIFLTITTISMLSSVLLTFFCTIKSDNNNFLVINILLSLMLYLLSYYTYKQKLYLISYIFPLILNSILFINSMLYFLGTNNIYTYIIILYAIISAFLFIYNIYKLKSGIATLRQILVADAEKKDNFYANVNHDLRTPLHIILGMNEMIMRESISPNVTEYAISSHKAGEHLMTLINKLMIYSKLGHGKISPINVQFSLPILIDTYIIGYRKLCTQKGIAFNTNVSANIPNDLIGDNILLRQIIYNLTTNLTLLTESKTITSNFYWDNITSTQGILHFDIAIPNIISDDNDLDLKTVTDIVDIMNGTLKITKNDSGTQIKVYMPFDSNKTKSGVENNSFQYNPNSSDFIAPNAKILIVDDTEMNIKVFSLLLKRTLIKIDSALNGYDALKLIEKKKYDLIFIDYMMPEMNGAELYSLIKEKHPNILKTTPIFVISANTATDTREKLINLGFNGFLPKPIESSTLDFIIRHNLSKELISSQTDMTSNVKPSNNKYNEFAFELNNFDITLNEGLKYMNDDIVQYANVAELVVKNYNKTLNNVINLHKENNIKDLGITIHALKGNAKYIGATTLYNISQTIEIRSNMNDVEFITLALPLLYYEWDKVINGLTLFLDKYNNSQYAATIITTTDNINTDSYLEQLIDYVDDLQPEPAIKLIQKVIKQNLAPEHEIPLKKVADYLEEFEYDEAMNILKEINQCSKDPD